MTRHLSSTLLLFMAALAAGANGLEVDGPLVFSSKATVATRTEAPSVATTAPTADEDNTQTANDYWHVSATNAPTDQRRPELTINPEAPATTEEPLSNNVDINSPTTLPSDGLLEANNEFLGIPGTQQTINGYDTALGDDPICWIGAAANRYDNVTGEITAEERAKKTVFPNPLVENFTLFGETKILKSCPEGNLVTVQQPVEGTSGERLRTLQWYNYSLHVELDLDTLEGDYVVTDNGTSTIALQVVVCGLGKSGFCSPFVHEQANLRESIEKANNLNSGETLPELSKTVRGDLHGGSHVHSPWIYLDMKQNRTIRENVSIPLLVNHPGEYFVIGTVQLYTGINGSVAYRHDISNAMNPGAGRYISYQAPAVTMEVSDPVLYISYAAIAVAGSIIVFLIFQTHHHKQQQVLQLSQADFLIVFLVCALAATILSFLLQPKSDIYCRISYPLILIPIQLMYAITVGRLWRIHAVISPLLLEHLTKGETDLTQRFVEAITFVSFKLNNLFVKKQDMRRSTHSSVKQQISQFQLALVVAMFTFPQFVLQVVALIFQPQQRQIVFNEDESMGRPTCSAGVDAAHNLLTYSMCLLILLVIILLFMAHSSRKLPSLFNETRVIYDSTFLSMVLMLLGAAVIALTDAPGTSPDVQYLVSLFLILSITLNSAVRILLPKLNMVWNGEVVVVSKLVTDHHRRAREREAERNSLMSGVTGFDPTSNALHGSFSGKEVDYDSAQASKRLETIHSNSCETGLMDSKSSVEESGKCGTTNGQSALDTEVGLPGTSEDRLSFVDEGDEAAIAPSSTELLDVESGASFGSAAGEKQAFTTHEDASHAEVAKSDDHPIEGCSTDGDIDLESAEEVTRMSLEKRTNGFLKHALPRGLSKQFSSWKQSGKSLKSNEVGDDEKSKSGEAPKSKPRRKKRLAQRIVVTEEETPARRLVLKMLDLQDQLEEVNNKIMSGLAVTKEDWGEITSLTTKLDRTFKDEVEFEWDIQKHYEQSLHELMPPDMASVKSGDSGNGRMSSPQKLPPPKRGVIRKTQSSSAAHALKNADEEKTNTSVHSSPRLMDAADDNQLSDRSFY